MSDARQLTHPPIPPTLDRASRPVVFQYRGRTMTVTRPVLHPADRLQLHCPEWKGHYVIGHLTPGMTRGDVRRLAIAFLDERPQIFRR